MKIYDLTHTIEEGMPVYPGTETPSLETIATIAHDGFEEKRIIIWSHTGTHIDGPSHIIPGGRTLDRYPIEHFSGQAVLLEVSAGPREGEIGLSQLTPHAELIGKVDFVLLKCGWSRYWGTPGYLRGYPVLSPEAALWLAGFTLKGLGLDAISFDRVDSTEFPNHRTFLSRDILLIENLANLAALAQGPFHFSCMPLKIAGSEGAPARAVAIFQD